jgi:hypothetical protein
MIGKARRPVQRPVPLDQAQNRRVVIKLEKID